MIISGALVIFVGGISAKSVVAAIIGLVLVGLGVLWLKSLKPTFYVALRTAGVESRALESKDAQWIERIVKGLNETIVARG